MITLEMVKAGYDAGIIKLIESPHKDGVVCCIGDNWFYFGGGTAEESSVESYQRDVPVEDIVREIYETLDDFRQSGETYKDEYLYYFYYLSENLKEVPNKASSPKDIKTVLYNAISCLIDETWGQYGSDNEEWFKMFQNELGVTAAELAEMGILVSVDGGLKLIEKEPNKTKSVESPLMSFIDQEVPFRMRELNGIEISDKECSDLVDALKENTDVMFDYDAIDDFLMEKLYELRSLDGQKIHALRGEISNLYHELNGAVFHDEESVPAIERRLNELTLRLAACEQGLEFLPDVFKVDAASVEKVIYEAVENIHSNGINNGSGYYELNAFETDSGRVSLWVDISISEDGSGYHVYYVMGLADRCDNMFSEWASTERLDMDELCKVVCEIANTDFSESVVAFLKNERSIDEKLGDAAERSRQPGSVRNNELDFVKE